MPLPVLLILVIGGDRGDRLAAARDGQIAPVRAQRPDRQTARAAWLRHFADDTVREILIADDDHAVLVLTDRGPGLLWSFGADTVGRPLQHFTFQDGDTHQTIRFNDFAAPRVRLHLTTENRARWQEHMRQA